MVCNAGSKLDHKNFSYGLGYPFSKDKKPVTVQYLHSYEQKSNENRLRRWDFCVQPSGFWHIHAKTPRGIVASE